jgi:tripartite-type tricarboxylate transporter receptor subunit TctC
MNRRRVALEFVSALIAISAGLAHAQSYPTRPVKLIVPAAPGSVPDATARPLADKLGSVLGQPVVIENRPGAGGILGMELVAKAAPDGYTLGLANMSQLVFNPYLFSNLPYQPMRDVQPVARLASVAMVLAVHPSVPVASFAEFKTWARAQGGKPQYGVPPMGTPPHVLALMLQRSADIQLEAVPFKGSAEAVAGAVSGEVPIVVEAPPVVAPHVRAGRLKAVVVTGETREQLLPDTPTIAEAGSPSGVADTWLGVVAPAGTPRPIVDRLNAEIARVMADDTVRATYLKFGWKPLASSPEEFAAVIRVDNERWGKVIRDAGLRLQ